MAGVQGAALRLIATVAMAHLAVPLLGLRTSAADTLEWALAQAYQNNPTLNAQRATARALDEGVPQALSGYRPRVALTANVGSQYQKTQSKSFPGGQGTPVSGPGSPGTGAIYSTSEAAFTVNAASEVL
jgi:outer membrane protein